MDDILLSVRNLFNPPQWCFTCKEMKLISEFQGESSRGYCKACNNKKSSENYYANKSWCNVCKQEMAQHYWNTHIRTKNILITLALINMKVKSRMFIKIGMF